MTVFTWSPEFGRPPAIEGGNDNEFSTDYYWDYPRCFMCGESLSRGDRVWAWQGHATTFAHAACMKKNAPGLLADIAKVMRP